MSLEEMHLWAEAISARISDEWHGSFDFKDDASTLRDVFYSLLIKNPDELAKLIGTGIIEENYFEDFKTLA